MKRSRKYRKRHLLPGPAGLLQQRHRNQNEEDGERSTVNQNENSQGSSGGGGKDRGLRKGENDGDAEVDTLSSFENRDGKNSTTNEEARSDNGESKPQQPQEEQLHHRGEKGSQKDSTNLHSQIWDVMCCSLDRILPPLPSQSASVSSSSTTAMSSYLYRLRQSLHPQYTLLSEIILSSDVSYATMNSNSNNNIISNSNSHYSNELYIVPKIVVQFQNIYSHHGHCDYTVDLLDESILYLLSQQQHHSSSSNNDNINDKHQLQKQLSSSTHQCRIMAWLSQSFIKNYPHWIKPGVVLLCRNVSIAIFGNDGQDEYNHNDDSSCYENSFNLDNTCHFDSMHGDSGGINRSSGWSGSNNNDSNISIEKMLLIGEENVIYAWGVDAVDDITHSDYIELIEKRVQKEMIYNVDKEQDGFHHEGNIEEAKFDLVEIASQVQVQDESVSQQEMQPTEIIFHEGNNDESNDTSTHQLLTTLDADLLCQLDKGTDFNRGEKEEIENYIRGQVRNQCNTKTKAFSSLDTNTNTNTNNDDGSKDKGDGSIVDMTCSVQEETAEKNECQIQEEERQISSSQQVVRNPYTNMRRHDNASKSTTSIANPYKKCDKTSSRGEEEHSPKLCSQRASSSLKNGNIRNYVSPKKRKNIDFDGNYRNMRENNIASKRSSNTAMQSQTLLNTITPISANAIDDSDDSQKDTINPNNHNQNYQPAASATPKESNIEGHREKGDLVRKDASESQGNEVNNLQQDQHWLSLLQSDECDDAFDEQQEEENAYIQSPCQEQKRFPGIQVSSSPIIDSDGEKSHHDNQELSVEISAVNVEQNTMDSFVEISNEEKNNTTKIFDAFADTDMDAFDEE